MEARTGCETHQPGAEFPSRRWPPGPGLGIAQAQAELDTRIEQFRQKYPQAVAGDRHGRGVVSLREDIIGRTDRLLEMLAAAVGLVLLIAAANLTNLLLVNGAGRLQEFAARRALGASSGRLVRQLLTEAVVLAAAGILAGLVIAQLAVSALLAVSGTVIPRTAEIAVDSTGVLFVSLLALVISVGASLLPAVQLSVFRSRGIAGQRSFTLAGRKLRAAFVCAEVTLSGTADHRRRPAGSEFCGGATRGPRLSTVGCPEPSVVASARSLQKDRGSRTILRAALPSHPPGPGVSAVAAANVVPMNGYLASSNIQTRDQRLRRSTSCLKSTIG